jgi:hypothetical protein
MQPPVLLVSFHARGWDAAQLDNTIAKVHNHTSAILTNISPYHEDDMIDFRTPPAMGAFDYLLRPSQPHTEAPPTPPSPPYRDGRGPQRVHIEIELIAQQRQPEQRPSRLWTLVWAIFALALIASLGGCAGVTDSWNINHRVTGDPCALCGGTLADAQARASQATEMAREDALTVQREAKAAAWSARYWASPEGRAMAAERDALWRASHAGPPVLEYAPQPAPLVNVPHTCSSYSMTGGSTVYTDCW